MSRARHQRLLCILPDLAERQIVVGGDLWGSSGAAAFLAYLKALAGEGSPRICFLPTAAGDPDSYIAAFLVEMLKAGCRPSVAKLFYRAGQDLRSRLHADSQLCLLPR